MLKNVHTFLEILRGYNVKLMLQRLDLELFGIGLNSDLNYSAGFTKNVLLAIRLPKLLQMGPLVQIPR